MEFRRPVSIDHSLLKKKKKKATFCDALADHLPSLRAEQATAAMETTSSDGKVMRCRKRWTRLAMSTARRSRRSPWRTRTSAKSRSLSRRTSTAVSAHFWGLPRRRTRIRSMLITCPLSLSCTGLHSFPAIPLCRGDGQRITDKYL